ncbi:efflux RND transporter periplasmic adaptor subunit [Arcobacter aquimarinus]|uniref:RND family efflux system, membrane fusion protein n=1 Tax=Arcobacter aquimarinus TaxID=1315211 RepID=A0AAE7E018_9BACT|nr:efflux RND transporter periplasmic adaptor subunit [Arcobacter aquimarinus]QKE25538.1 RND family efflux system, membrane fusion protein [Arcobacter aquimarinus]RXI32632.1 efflux transporter periplasmic adaptor subunit [Arcobacter aquimarinus]
MKKFLKISIPLVIITATAIMIYIIFANPPQMKKEITKVSKIQVEVKNLNKEKFQVFLDSYGTAQASTKTTLTSQVSGKIIFINENFKNGGYFKKGDLLVQIEDEDYKADVKIANAQLILAKQTLLEEQAKAKQAKEDWKKFNIDEKPDDLVLRVPQLQSAIATVEAKEADLQKAKLNLNRTKILAPYDGRVIEKSISIAQVISNNAQIGTIFSNDNIEVRLPIKNKDLNLIDINLGAKVEFISQLSNKIYEGKIVRSESTIDENTKQLYLIAQIDENISNLKIGEYLKAKIEAKKLENVIIIPNETIYQSSYVYVQKDGILEKRVIEISWQNDEYAVISNGLKENDNLILTTLGSVKSGTKVEIINKENKGQKQ